MKRLKIWLRSLSLLQQFLLLAFCVAIFFMIFFFTVVPESIDSFVNTQMYDYIHNAQENLIANNLLINGNEEERDSNVNHFIYSKSNHNYLSDVNPDQQQILDNIDPDVKADPYYDGVFSYEGRAVVYSIRDFDNYSIVSIIQNDFRNEYRKALNDSTINMMIIVVVGLYSFLIMWVMMLIHPLNQIKNYIDKIKDGEKAKLNISRKDEIGEVAEALLDMQEELSKQEKIREEMIQNISHDLKTPIATIKSYSESIKDGIYPYDTLEKSVDVIIEHADRLEKKVYSLITFNKLGYLVDDLEEGDNLPMRPIVQKAILSARVIRKDVHFETELEDINFHGAEEPWRIVVENLIDNALRYAKSVVKLTLNKDGLCVYNDGKQMEEERIEKLFKPYEMGTDGKFGLGLSIVKRVTETYGYRVSGENMNDGVIFRVLRPKGKRKKHSAQKG